MDVSGIVRGWTGVLMQSDHLHLRSPPRQGVCVHPLSHTALCRRSRLGLGSQSPRDDREEIGFTLNVANRNIKGHNSHIKEGGGCEECAEMLQ